MQLTLARPIAVPRLSVGWLAGATFGVALIALFLRAPYTLLNAEFWADDGALFTHALDRGPAVLMETYAGYLIVVQQLGVLLELVVPPAYAPLVGNGLALVAMAAVATYIAVATFPWPRPVSLAMAAVVVLTPGNREMIGTLSHLVWPVGLWLAMVPLAREPASRSGKVVESVGLVLAGLTGPFAVLFGPLYLFGPRRRLITVAIPAVIQLGAWALSERRSAVGVDPELLPQALVLRGLVTPVVGPSAADNLAPAAVFVVGAILAGCLWLVWHRMPRRVGIHLAYLGLVPLALGMVNNSWPFADYLDPWIASRYFWLAGIVIAWSVVLTWPRLAPLRSPAHIVLVALIVLGMALHVRWPTRPDMNWSELSSCIGGPVACEVPVLPAERWNVRYEP